MRRTYKERLNIGGDVEWLDCNELVDAVLLEPGEEMAHGSVIGRAGILIADGRGARDDHLLFGFWEVTSCRRESWRLVVREPTPPFRANSPGLSGFVPIRDPASTAVVEKLKRLLRHG
jgi:hypothetical protein